MIAGSIEIQILTNLARLQTDMEKANRTVSKAMSGIEASAKMAARALGGIVGVLGIREIAQTADNYTKLTAQLKLATRSAEEYAQAYSNVQRISRTAQVDLNGTAQVYARLSNALRDTGASQKQVADISETISLALRVNGATAAETTSAMLQLSQAFGSGRLAGEEFRAVSEAAPGLLRELARAINVPVGALKEMAKEGKLTSDVLANAWTNPEYLAGLREQAKEVQTMGSALVVLRNNFTTLIGKMNETSGTGSAVGKTILWVADSMGFMADAIFAVVEVVAALEKSLLAAGHNFVQLLKIAAMGANPMLAIINKDEILSTFNELKAFNEAYADDMRATFSKSFTHFRDSLKAARDDSSLPFDEKPLQVYGAAIDKTAEKAEKLRDKQRLKELQAEIDFEEEMRETRAKVAFEEAEKARKEMEAAEKYRADFIMKRNKEISDEYLRTVKEQNDKAQREYDRFYDRLSQSITDALFRGFESGKDFVQNFKDTMIRAFQTLVLQPQIDLIVRGSGVGALFGAPGIANAGGLVSGGGFGGGNIFSTLKDGLSSLNTNVVGSIEKLGVFLSNGQGGLADKLGGFFGQYSSQIAGALSFAPAVFSLLKGDLKSAAFQGGGAAIGTLLGGPVGGAIGSFLGGALGGLFGGKKVPMIGSQSNSVYANGALTGSNRRYGSKDLGAGASVQGLTDAFSGSLGGLLGAFGINDSVSSNSVLRQRTNARGFFNAYFGGQSVHFGQTFGKKADFGQAFQQMASQVMGPLLVQAIQKSNLTAGIKSLFDGISAQADVQNMIQAAVNLKNSQAQLTKTYDITADSAARAARETGATGNALVELLNKMIGAANAYKTVGEVLVEAQTNLVGSLGVSNPNSLPATLKAFDEILKGIDKSTPAGIKKFSDLFMVRDQYAAYRQSVDQLQGGVRGSIFGMSSPAIQQQMMQEDLAKMFAELGRDVPGSIEELINLGKSIDYTTKEGLDLAAVFPSLVQAFQQTRGQVDGLINSLTELNPNLFGSRFAFERAKGFVRNGISLDRLPSYDVGTPFVPNDGPAMIHRGERILTAAENRNFSTNNADVVSELRRLNANQQNMSRELQAIAVSTRETATTVDKLRRDGFLLRDVDNDGNDVVIPVEVVA
jgi:tape measure domain-containing protein